MATLNPETLFPIMRAAFVGRVPCELVSPPGMGKTSIMEQFCQHMADTLKRPFGLAKRIPATEDAAEVAGLPVLGELDMGFGSFPSAVRSYPSVFPRPPRKTGSSDRVYFPAGYDQSSWKWGTAMPPVGIVFLDELRQAPHDVQKPLARFMEERQLAEFCLDDYGHWAVFAASNRSSDRSGANKDLAFIKNRKMVIEIEPDAKALATYMEGAKFHPHAVAYVRAFPGEVFTMEMPASEGQFVTPRSLCKAFSILKIMAGKSHTMPTHEAAAEAVAGLVGEAAATSVMAFLKRVELMPSMDAILAEPEAVPVPTRVDVVYAVSQMMLEYLNPDTAGAILKYMSRWEYEDMQAGFIQAAIRRDPTVAALPEFAAWIRDNQKLAFAANSLRR